MPSPFPGMNPFIEQNETWEDFHHEFFSRVQEILCGIVGPNYLVKIKMRLYHHDVPSVERGVVDGGEMALFVGQDKDSLPVAVPRQTSLQELSLPKVDTERYTWLEILDGRTRKVLHFPRRS